MPLMISTLPRWKKILLALMLLFGLAILAGWLRLTPPGLLGKADAIGYAFCHRIAVRSFLIGERPMPMCVRCTGMYLGAFFTLLFFWLGGRARYSEFPVKVALVALGGGLLAFAVDGSNSFLTLLPGLPHLYTPNHYLRMATGLSVGMGLACLIAPVFAGSVWRDWEPLPVVGNLRELGGIALSLALLGAVAFLQLPNLQFLLALVSSAGVFLLLSMITTILLLNFFDWSNRFTETKWVVLVWGLGALLTLAEISLMDFVRYQLTGTWGGFLF